MASRGVKKRDIKNKHWPNKRHLWNHRRTNNELQQAIAFERPVEKLPEETSFTRAKAQPYLLNSDMSCSAWKCISSL